MARRRIAFKLAMIIVTAAFVIAGLVWSIDDQALDNLKHRLSLWTLIALLLIINVVSFVSFLVMYTAWKWVRNDLKNNNNPLGATDVSHSTKDPHVSE